MEVTFYFFFLNMVCAVVDYISRCFSTSNPYHSWILFALFVPFCYFIYCNICQKISCIFSRFIKSEVIKDVQREPRKRWIFIENPPAFIYEASKIGKLPVFYEVFSKWRYVCCLFVIKTLVNSTQGIVNHYINAFYQQNF